MDWEGRTCPWEILSSADVIPPPWSWSWSNGDKPKLYGLFTVGERGAHQESKEDPLAQNLFAFLPQCTFAIATVLATCYPELSTPSETLRGQSVQPHRHLSDHFPLRAEGRYLLSIVARWKKKFFLMFKFKCWGLAGNPEFHSERDLVGTALLHCLDLCVWAVFRVPSGPWPGVTLTFIKTLSC